MQVDTLSKERVGTKKQPIWPTLEQQLVASKVTHGSALEKLIIDNQDFQMLRPEEAHDQLRLPPWLRIYWRKKHPEANYSAKDPSGGYPLALRDLYLWMIRYQDLTVHQGPDSTSQASLGPENSRDKHGN